MAEKPNNFPMTGYGVPNLTNENYPYGSFYSPNPPTPITTTQPKQRSTSWLSGASDFLFGLPELLYNVFTNERSRNDYLKQQRVTNEFAKQQQDYQRNYFSLRAADLENAGLNPVLALGAPASPPVTPPPGGSAPQRNITGGNVLQSALLSAQLSQIRAQTSLTQAEAQRVQAETIATTKRADVPMRQLLLNEKLGEVEMLAKQYGMTESLARATAAKARTLLDMQDANYTARHSGDYRMPQRDPQLDDLDNLIKNALGTSNPNASVLLRLILRILKR